MLSLTTILYHMFRECAAKKCKQRITSEQNVIFESDEDDARLTDYPPVNNKVTPTFTVLKRFKKPTDYGTFELPNADSNH